MSTPGLARLPYDDAASLAEMTGDCRAVEHALRLPDQRDVAASRRPAARTVPAGTPVVSRRLAEHADGLARQLG